MKLPTPEAMRNETKDMRDEIGGPGGHAKYIDGPGGLAK